MSDPRLSRVIAEPQPYQEYKTFFRSIAGQNRGRFVPIRFGCGNGVFVYSNTPNTIQMDPDIKRHLILPYFNPHHRNVAQRLSNKYLMSHRVLADLINDPQQTFLNSLNTYDGITRVETRHVVVRSSPPVVEDGDPCAVVIETYGAYWDSYRKVWCCTNYRYSSDKEACGHAPWILAFVPPKLKRRLRL